jgi:Fe-Mn family superoxide dismutase
MKMFKLPNLEYDYDALGKSISGDTMRFHHDKHHQAYIDKLNVAVESRPELLGKTIEYLLTNIESLPDSVRTAITNNGGGHYNHSFFWLCMSPNGGGEPDGKVAELIKAKYGDFQKFMDEFNAKALSVFGSGWVWLQPNGDIITTPNQGTPIAMGLDSPLLCLDVWEHSYYLDYKNKRDEYVKSWWNVVNWDAVSKRYSER